MDIHTRSSFLRFLALAAVMTFILEANGLAAALVTADVTIVWDSEMLATDTVFEGSHFSDQALSLTTPMRVPDGSVYSGPDVYGALDRRDAGSWNVGKAGMLMTLKQDDADQSVTGLFLLKQEPAIAFAGGGNDVMTASNIFSFAIEKLASAIVRFVVSDQGQFYISEASPDFPASGNMGANSFSFAINALSTTWYAYDPTASVNSVTALGAQVQTPGFQNIDFVGVAVYITALSGVPDATGSIGVKRLVIEAEEAVIIASPAPSPMPTTGIPTSGPSASPSTKPSDQPTESPTMTPTNSPSSTPTLIPSEKPSPLPTDNPSVAPSAKTSDHPTTFPTSTPVFDPTKAPIVTPSAIGVIFEEPDRIPPRDPSPTAEPTAEPTRSPVGEPSMAPSPMPSYVPSPWPTTFEPTPEPTQLPTTVEPTPGPTSEPTPDPTLEPTLGPTSEPSQLPTPSPEEASSVTLAPTEMASTVKPIEVPSESEEEITVTPSDPGSSSPSQSKATTDEPTRPPVNEETSPPTSSPQQETVSSPSPSSSPSLSASLAPSTDSHVNTDTPSMHEAEPTVGPTSRTSTPTAAEMNNRAPEPTTLPSLLATDKPTEAPISSSPATNHAKPTSLASSTEPISGTDATGSSAPSTVLPSEWQPQEPTTETSPLAPTITPSNEPSSVQTQGPSFKGSVVEGEDGEKENSSSTTTATASQAPSDRSSTTTSQPTVNEESVGSDTKQTNAGSSSGVPTTTAFHQLHALTLRFEPVARFLTDEEMVVWKNVVTDWFNRYYKQREDKSRVSISTLFGIKQQNTVNGRGLDVSALEIMLDQDLTIAGDLGGTLPADLVSLPFTDMIANEELGMLLQVSLSAFKDIKLPIEAPAFRAESVQTEDDSSANEQQADQEKYRESVRLAGVSIKVRGAKLVPNPYINKFEETLEEWFNTFYDRDQVCSESPSGRRLNRRQRITSDITIFMQALTTDEEGVPTNEITYSQVIIFGPPVQSSPSSRERKLCSDEPNSAAVDAASLSAEEIVLLPFQDDAANEELTKALQENVAGLADTEYPIALPSFESSEVIAEDISSKDAAGGAGSEEWPPVALIASIATAICVGVASFAFFARRKRNQ